MTISRWLFRVVCMCVLLVTAPARGANFTRVLSLPNAAPFAPHPEVLVHTTDGFNPRGPVNFVVYLHGWYSCIAVAISATDTRCAPQHSPRSGMDVLGQFDAAHINAVLLVPQMPFDAANGSAGRLGEHHGFRRLLAAVLAHPDVQPLLGSRTLADVGRVALIAHSGSYLATSAMALQGGVDVHEIHLLDALYGARGLFQQWVLSHLRDFVAHRRLTLLYSVEAGQGSNVRRLLDQLAAHLPATAVLRSTAVDPLPPASYRTPLVAQRTTHAHAHLPPRWLAPLLSAGSFPTIQPTR